MWPERGAAKLGLVFFPCRSESLRWARLALASFALSSLGPVGCFGGPTSDLPNSLGGDDTGGTTGDSPGNGEATGGNDGVNNGPDASSGGTTGGTTGSATGESDAGFVMEQDAAVLPGDAGGSGLGPDGGVDAGEGGVTCTSGPDAGDAACVEVSDAGVGDAGVDDGGASDAGL